MPDGIGIGRQMLDKSAPFLHDQRSQEVEELQDELGDLRLRGNDEPARVL